MHTHTHTYIHMYINNRIIGYCVTKRYAMKRREREGRRRGRRTSSPDNER